MPASLSGNTQLTATPFIRPRRYSGINRYAKDNTSRPSSFSFDFRKSSAAFFIENVKQSPGKYQSL
jgi:hypothetical protein